MPLSNGYSLLLCSCNTSLWGPPDHSQLISGNELLPLPLALLCLLVLDSVSVLWQLMCVVVVIALFMLHQHPHYLYVSCAAWLANVWLIFYLFDHKHRWRTSHQPAATSPSSHTRIRRTRSNLWVSCTLAGKDIKAKRQSLSFTISCPSLKFEFVFQRRPHLWRINN